MTFRTNNKFHKTVLSSVGLVTIYMLSASNSSAECEPWSTPGHLDTTCVDHVGTPICIHEPKRVPGLSGMPKWLGSGEIGDLLEVVSDPRWGNAPLRSSLNANGVDIVRYRILVDSKSSPNQLAVSIQVKADPGSPGGSDSYVYFGLGKADATEAWGVQIPAYAGTGLVGPHLQVREDYVNSYHYTNIEGWEPPGQGEFPSDPAWITADKVAIWNAPTDGPINENGTYSYVIQFKIDLTVLPFAATDGAFLMLGVHNDFSDAGVGAVTDYYTPNMDWCPAPCGTTVNGDSLGTERENAGPFHFYVNEWAQVLPVGEDCTGIDVQRTDISTNYDGNKVSVKANAINEFRVRPHNLDPLTSQPGDVHASFKMSNWGSVATAAAWTPVPHLDVYNGYDVSLPIVASCNNGIYDNDVCDAGIITHCGEEPGECNAGFHQCLQVELFAGTGAESRVSFENATAYTNTRFGYLSSLDEAAEINVKGLQALLGNSHDRDVYLHVVPTNMPKASDKPMELAVEGLEKLRAQAYPDFQVENYLPACPNFETAQLQCVRQSVGDNEYQRVCQVRDKETEQRCQSDLSCIRQFGCWGLITPRISETNEVWCSMGGNCSDDPTCSYLRDTAVKCLLPTNTQVRKCATLATSQEGGQYLCSDEAQALTLPDGSHWCPTELSCSEPVAGGGIDYDVSSLSPSQKLTAEYPTYEVFPYYDSGERVMINGQERKRLVPMPTFGFHLAHEGTFYGFLHSLVAQDGSALEAVASHFYKITVPNEGTARVRVLVSAEEQPHFIPLTDITGSATTVFWPFGMVNLSGVMESTASLDLRTATITLNQILDDNGEELVMGMTGPIAMTARSGATATHAKFISAAGPDVVMEVMELPLIGYVVKITVGRTAVGRPSTCGWFGSANLGTAFTINDGVHPALKVQGVDQWSCMPFSLSNSY